jgi:cytochrome c6
MKRLTFMTAILAVSVCLLSSSVSAKDAPAGKSGEELFKEHCAACHPNGGNILSPQKTLSRKDREANNIKTADDIVKKMRNPGPFPTHPQEWAGMRMFDEKTISKDDAQKIANYILKTFQ